MKNVCRENTLNNEAIYHFRKECGWSQTDLSKKLGCICGQRTISNIEAFKHYYCPSIYIFEAFLLFLNPEFISPQGYVVICAKVAEKINIDNAFGWLNIYAWYVGKAVPTPYIFRKLVYEYFRVKYGCKKIPTFL